LLLRRGAFLKMSEIRSIGVVGAGTMGHGIAQVAAVAGCDVVLVDVAAEALDHALGKMRSSMDRMVAKEILTAEGLEAALGRITTSGALEDLADVDLVVEAVVEKLEVKSQVLSELDRSCRRETILASNTSSISITRLAAATSRPEKVIGMHFMNPVPMMKLVEIIRGLETDQGSYDLVEALTCRMGKTAVEVQDSAGFVSNRVLMPMINEAVFCVFEGVAEATAIDEVMQLGMNHPMGPLALADLIGLDVCLDILDVLYVEFRDPKYRPCPLLVRMVDAGRLGRKSGRGFYDYS
jgi:3-hydroxybutyryl-CoA dehydrogenase